ncbi:MAG: L-fucose/L-arabinose isomerase family protein [Promethearchaeota archaeon]
MKKKITIGVVCIARKTFDFNIALEIYKSIQENLKNIKRVQWEIIQELVIEIKNAQDAATLLSTKRIDALICISGTFALGHLILELNKVLNCPILLWGLEEPPYDGGKIRLNSVCGINLNASNLYKAGIKNYYVSIGNQIDEAWLDAIRILAALKNAHIGIIGSRAYGFFNLDVDELELYNKLGVLIDYYQLTEIFSQNIDNSKLDELINKIKSIFNVSTLSPTQLNKVAQLVLKFESFIKERHLTSLAIRCWPEFTAEFGISPCAAMSYLQSENRILTCEGDVLGSLSMLAHAAIGAETPFLADLSQVNFKDDFALLWHCGVAPCNLWDGKCERSLDTYFAGGKGVTADFVMKSGEISVLRLDYSPPNEYRIFIQKGNAVPMEKELKGTYLKVTFEKGIRNVFNKVIDNGLAHHISVVYGDFIKPLEIFAKLTNWRLIQ